MSLTTPVNKQENDRSGLDESKRSIAYSMDLLIPGLYIWLGSFTMRLFGAKPDDTPHKYPGMLHSKYGLALVLPSYRIFTTYQDTLERNHTPYN
jgi:hypothetical protein